MKKATSQRRHSEHSIWEKESNEMRKRNIKEKAKTYSELQRVEVDQAVK